MGGGAIIPLNIDLSGKTAIVTGGTRGIGRSIVEHLLEGNSTVLYTGTKKLHKSPIANATYYQLNLSDETSLQGFIDSTVSKMERIDILINNAGINFIEPIDRITNDHWDEILTVNLTGPMKLTRAVAQVMKKNKEGGRILNISSIFGIISKAKRDAYSASKSGLIGLTKASALDLAPHNILVNALCPGFTETELTRSILSEKEMKQLSTQVPLQRFADVSEIATLAVTLCSNLNTYLTGQTIIVDGGVTTQ